MSIRHALQVRRPRHAESAIALATAVSLVMALLVSLVAVAVRTGGLARLGALGGTSLDYARGPLGEYFPLTDEFVHDSLGSTFGSRPAPSASMPSDGTQPPASSGAATAGSDAEGAVPPPDEVAPDLGNDNFASAYRIRGLPFTARTTKPSTREPGEPEPCGPPGGGGGTRWFRFTPRTDIGLLANTWGTELGASITVYTGTSMSDLTVIQCTGGPNGGGQVTFAAKAGTTYWFQPTKTVGSGALVFNLNVQGRTSLASVSNDGRPADGESGQPVVSANGRYVVFRSAADLVPGTANGCVSGHHPLGTSQFAAAPGPCTNIYRRDLVTKRTVLVSTADAEVGGNDDSHQPEVSADGRFVVFTSWASNLVPNDTNDALDVFLRDIVAGQTIRVSVTSSGQQTREIRGVHTNAISAAGRFVAFGSSASELDSGPDGSRPCGAINCVSVYIRDVHMGRTHLVSVDEDGDSYRGLTYVQGLSADGSRLALTINANTGTSEQMVVSDWQRPGRVEVASVADNGDDANGASYSGLSNALSADGRFITFLSSASNLVSGDTNDAEDVFVRDLVTRRTIRVSVSSNGTQAEPGNDPGNDPVAEQLTSASQVSIGFTSAAISPDGRYVVFSSRASNLVPGDDNGTIDVFVRDLRRSTTTRVSVRDDGTQSSGVSYRGGPSRGARTVTFLSRGFNPGDDTTTFSVYVRQMPAT